MVRVGEVGYEVGYGAGVDGFSCQVDACGEVGGEVGGDEDGGGVEEDDVAAGAAFAGEDGGEDLGVSAGVSAAEGFDGGAREADLFGGDGGKGNDTVVDLGDMAGAGDGELVHTRMAAGATARADGLAVDDEGVACVEQDHGFGGEGDWKTSALLHVLKVAGSGRPGGTSFMEDYTYDLDTDRPKILGAHMLEVCPSITTERPRL